LYSIKYHSWMTKSITTLNSYRTTKACNPATHCALQTSLYVLDSCFLFQMTLQ
jgi:hypothetical protein